MSKRAENMIYDYLLKRFKIGWSMAAIQTFYNNLTYRQVIDESADINKFFDSLITLASAADIEHDPKLKFSIKNLSYIISDSWEEIEERNSRLSTKETIAIMEDSSYYYELTSIMISEGGPVT